MEQILPRQPFFPYGLRGASAICNRPAGCGSDHSLTGTIKHIDLRWGDDLRVDVLTPDLAAVGASYSEFRIQAEGHQANEAGYFTGVAQFVNGRWQFRNGHWSVVVPPAKVP